MTMASNTSLETLHDRPTVAPRVDILETAAGVRLVADMPGVAADALEINVEPGRLHLSARRVIDAPEGATALLGVVKPDYERTFSLSDDVDLEQIEASLVDGVLTLDLPKHARSKPRRISVQRG